MGSPSLSSGVLRFGPFELDPKTQQLRKAGVLLRIQPQPLKVLAVLASRHGQIVTREELRHELWGDETFVDFEQGLNYCIRQIRVILEDDAQRPRYIETIARRGYRFVRAVEGLAELRQDSIAASRAEEYTILRRKAWLIGAAALLLVAIGIAGYVLRARSSRHLTQKDTIVIAEFDNTTGDPVFDGALRQGLSVQIEQSPFLNMLSDERIGQALSLMGQPKDTRLTYKLAREVCQRTSSAVVLDGSIAQVGTEYLLTLKSVGCTNGESLASAQAQAGDKNHVLSALGKIASEMRTKLGESVGTVRKFDTPLEQATTPSLEALQAYSLGRKTLGRGEPVAALPLFQRAIGLDPNFAMAYAALGTSYENFADTSQAAENIKKAHKLRDHVSEHEKFYIESKYCLFVAGDLKKALQNDELWAQTYPRDDTPRHDLSAIFDNLGQYDRSLEASRDALSLDPAIGANYANLVSENLNLNRLGDAQAAAEEAQKKDFDSVDLRWFLYLLDFAKNDAAGMAQQASWFDGNPETDGWAQALEANTAAYYGHLERARELSRQGVAKILHVGLKEPAAGGEAEAAQREALFGNATEARQRAAAALHLSKGRDVEYEVAWALALAGDSAQSQTLAKDLAARFPEDTIVQYNYLPTIHAQLALNRKDYATAIDALQTAAPYELGNTGNYPFTSLQVVYVRGAAYLSNRQGEGQQAAAQFQKIIDHRGIVINEPIGVMAYLGLARAFAMQGDANKAKAAYRDFLTLWKDADPGIPILKEAKAEYAKLQ